jgi:hypothetical protein
LEPVLTIRLRIDFFTPLRARWLSSSITALYKASISAGIGAAIEVDAGLDGRINAVGACNRHGKGRKAPPF